MSQDIYVDEISYRQQATTSHVSSPATMETELLQSTSLKSGTKAYHHAQNMLNITLLCQAQLVPFVQKKIAEMTRKSAPPDCMQELSWHKKALTPHVLNDRPNAFQKMR